MKTFLITTTLLLTILSAGRAETNIATEPIHYRKLQREVRWTAQTALTIQLPYESLDSAEGNRLMRNVVKLAALEEQARQQLDPALLSHIETVCEDLTE